MEYIILLKVFMCLAGCIIVISAINHKLGYDKAQQIQSVSMGFGMLFLSFVLWLHFNKNMTDDLSLLLSACAAYEYTFSEALRHSAFSVASVISTTGFVTENFDLWPTFSRTILVMIMFIGACAGSTGGGIKVSRVIVLYKGAKHEMKRVLHPKQIKKISMDGHIVEHEVVRNTTAYLVTFIILFVVSLLVVSLDPAVLGDKKKHRLS